MKALACLFVAFPAMAQENCLPHPALPDFLMERYGETLQSRAVTQSGEVLETYAAQGGNWTMVIVRDGVACLLVDGYEFVPVPQGMAG